MKAKKTLVSIVSIAFIFCIFTTNAWSRTKVLRLVTSAPAGAFPLWDVLDRMAKRFNQRANGEYKIEVHAGGALAKLPEFLDAVNFGTVEMAQVPFGFFSRLDPRLGVTENPFILNNYKAGVEASPALQTLFDQVFQERFNAKNLQCYIIGGFDFLSASKITSLEDLKGKMFGVTSPNGAELIKILGGSPVFIPWTEYYSSLQKKIIDALTQMPKGILVTSTYNVAKYYTYAWMFSGMHGLAINLDVWNKMPPEIQKILQEEAQIAQDWIHSVCPSQLKKDYDDLRAKGVQIYVLPEVERMKWKKLTENTVEAKFKKLGAFGAEAKRVIEDANRKHPYQSPDL